VSTVAGAARGGDAHGPEAAASASEASRDATAGVDRRGITTLSVGHACVDVTQGAVPALLPFLIDQRGYGYGAAAALVLAMTGSSSLLQPLFGFLADRRSLAWLLPGGVALAAVGIALTGLVESYALTFALIALAGLGVGAYHPEGARYANYVSGDLRATGMSFYSVGGNVGFALGPILVTPLVLIFGLSGTVWLAPPLLIVAALLARELPHLRSFQPERRAAASGEPAHAATPDRWGPFTRVATIAGVRSGVYFGLQAFVPAYFIVHFHSSAGVGNAALTTLLICGALGTLVGGRLADRVGRRRIMIACTATLTPLLLLFLVAGELAAFPLLGLVGFFTVGSFAITVVLGQEYLPNRIGIASGVTLGAAIGVGGVVAWLLGLLADSVGLTPVLAIVALLPLPALALTLTLPRERPHSVETAG
jgi:MFS transporter, FSR family, fosmidomycin resistance protein